MIAEKPKVAEVSGMPILGHLPEIQRKGFLHFFYDLWHEYGDVIQLKLGPMPTTMLVRPEHIQHVLVKNPETYIKGITLTKLRIAIGNGLFTLEGQEWRERRKLLQPTYTPTNIRGFADIMAQTAQETVSRWQELSPNTEVNINAEMTRATMTVISRAMFGLDVSEENREVSEAFVSFMEYATSSIASVIDMPLFVPTPRNQRLKHAKQVVRDFIFDVIAQRRAEGLGDDLLSMLMTLRDEDTGEALTDEELHDEILITFFAGHETTATLMTWTWYLLSQYPDVEAKLHAELRSVLNGRTPTLDDIPNLTYTRMIIDEVLRLYSPVGLTGRDVALDDEIGGIEIQKGGVVTIVPYITHRHPEFWERPLAFYPEHFTPEQVEKRPRYAYYPFGAGHRICIGNHFALMEAVIFLAEMAQRFQPRLSHVNHGEVKFEGVIRPEAPILTTLDPRD